jgi:hypothetical protein
MCVQLLMNGRSLSMPALEAKTSNRGRIGSIKEVMQYK